MDDFADAHDRSSRAQALRSCRLPGHSGGGMVTIRQTIFRGDRLRLSEIPAAPLETEQVEPFAMNVYSSYIYSSGAVNEDRRVSGHSL